LNFGVWQGVGDLRTDTSYRFSLKARGVGSPKEIGVQFSDDLDAPMNIIVDGKTEDTHLMEVSETTGLFEFDFKVEGESDSYAAWLTIGFGSAEKIYIDDVSLREVVEP
jgi:hypothetical protein